MSRFRPCIDLHEGAVKQIVGGTLGGDLRTNFVAGEGADYFARLYRADHLTGGHVIMLGAGNEEAALSALRAYPGGLQVGGGITDLNAAAYLEAGAEKVIVTSFVFRDGRVDKTALDRMAAAVGKARLVLDLSCRRRGKSYFVVTDRWRKFTEVEVNASTLEMFAESCSEFLIHAVDVEGKQAGVDEELLAVIAAGSPLPATYAGGIRDLADVAKVESSGAGKVDYTVGSALDIFGGKLPYRTLVERSRQHG